MESGGALPRASCEEQLQLHEGSLTRSSLMFDVNSKMKTTVKAFRSKRSRICVCAIQIICVPEMRLV